MDRLLTGFDAPTIQTLFVDRNLEYAGLIQAFHVRTVRILKTKGLIVRSESQRQWRRMSRMRQNCIQKQKKNRV